MGKQRYPKKNKYGNKPITVDGVRFDGLNEHRRWCFLQLMEKAGEISNLRYHVKFELIPQITKEEVVHLKTKDKVVTKVVQSAINYESDFTYTITSTGEEIIEDLKGAETDVFIIKKKLFFWKFGKHIFISKQINDISMIKETKSLLI